MSKEEYIPHAPVGPPAQSQRLEGHLNPTNDEQRLIKAALDDVDMALLLNQPVRARVEANTVSYDIGAEALQEPLSNNQSQSPQIVQAQPNRVSPSTPMQDYDWGELDEGWTREGYPKTDRL